MATSKRILNNLGLTLWMAAAVVMPNVSSAAPGTIADVPLFTQANADPNIMFILDSSISMNSTLGTGTRISVAKTALTDMVNSLNNVRTGFATFDSDVGASIIVPIDDVATNRSTITSNISSTAADDSTPLGEAMRDIGRYFANDSSGNCGGGGGSSTHLALHPGTADEDSTNSCVSILGSRITTAGPVQYQCQSNFAILLTDGLARGDQGLNGTPLEDYDGDCTAAAQTAGGYTCTGFDRKSNQTYDAANVETSDYLDDVAGALYDVDLRPDLNDADGNAVKNNVRTYVIAFAESGISSSQLLQDAASQGGGQFSFAGDGTDLASELNSATSSILNLIGSSAAVTFNSATLGTNSAVYLALFNSSSWSGDLAAYDLDDTTGVIAATSTWTAASSLDALTNSAAVSSRTILTYNGSSGIPFRWPADHTTPTATELDTSQINDLLTNAAVGATTAQKDTLGQNVVDFLRGDTSNEGSLFRNRTSRLGDIVHAGPVFVGPPELNWPDGTGGSDPFPTGNAAYSVYKLNTSTDTPAGKADRPGVVYIGSNDGMLHGFATETGTLGTAGDEVLAYAPHALFSTAGTRGYHYLTETGYNHQYYVDLLPSVSDIYDATNGWRTVLAGGLRGGGRALYALDVTNPQNFSEANASDIVMFEFTNADDADLGYTFSQPTIALMENGRWAMIVGNGYNPDTSGTATGKAYLYIIYLDADLSDGWDQGTAATDDYVKISTDTGDTTTLLNGLSTPTLVDIDGDGMVDRAYAGDLLGNMWAFDLSSGNPNSWDVAYKSGSTPKPLFISGSTQPITVQPEVVFNTDGDNSTDAPNTLVLFGTGQYVAGGDNANLGAQAFYGVWDKGTQELVPANLVAQTITETGTTRVVSSNAVDYSAATVFGWYISNLNLNSDGERVVTSPVVRGDIIYFNTAIPTNTTCSYGGTGWQMSIQYLTGANPTAAVFDSNGDGVVNGNDTPLSGVAFEQGLPASPSFLSDRRYTPGTRTQTGSEVVDDAVENLTGAGTGRLSWEELSQ